MFFFRCCSTLFPHLVNQRKKFFCEYNICIPQAHFVFVGCWFRYYSIYTHTHTHTHIHSPISLPHFFTFYAGFIFKKIANDGSSLSEREKFIDIAVEWLIYELLLLPVDNCLHSMYGIRNLLINITSIIVSYCEEKMNRSQNILSEVKRVDKNEHARDVCHQLMWIFYRNLVVKKYKEWSS